MQVGTGLCRRSGGERPQLGELASCAAEGMLMLITRLISAWEPGQNMNSCLLPSALMPASLLSAPFHYFYLVWPLHVLHQTFFNHPSLCSPVVCVFLPFLPPAVLCHFVTFTFFSIVLLDVYFFPSVPPSHNVVYICSSFTFIFLYFLPFNSYPQRNPALLLETSPFLLIASCFF